MQDRHNLVVVDESSKLDEPSEPEPSEGSSAGPSTEHLVLPAEAQEAPVLDPFWQKEKILRGTLLGISHSFRV